MRICGRHRWHVVYNSRNSRLLLLWSARLAGWLAERTRRECTRVVSGVLRVVAMLLDASRRVYAVDICPGLMTTTTQREKETERMHLKTSQLDNNCTVSVYVACACCIFVSFKCPSLVCHTLLHDDHDDGPDEWFLCVCVCTCYALVHDILPICQLAKWRIQCPKTYCVVRLYKRIIVNEIAKDLIKQLLYVTYM